MITNNRWWHSAVYQWLHASDWLLSQMDGELHQTFHPDQSSFIILEPSLWNKLSIFQMEWIMETTLKWTETQIIDIDYRDWHAEHKTLKNCAPCKNKHVASNIVYLIYFGRFNADDNLIISVEERSKQIWAVLALLNISFLTTDNLTVHTAKVVRAAQPS